MVYGRRYGFVGRNGLGKTTLLKMIGRCVCVVLCASVYSGQLRIPANMSVLHVEQEVAGDDTPVLQSVLDSDTQRCRLLAEEAQITSQLKECV
jgi:ATP-binding cassette subfamily F protein 3